MDSVLYFSFEMMLCVSETPMVVRGPGFVGRLGLLRGGLWEEEELGLPNGDLGVAEDGECLEERGVGLQALELGPNGRNGCAENQE